MVIRRFASGARAVSGLRSFSSSAAVLAASLVVASAALAQNPPTDPKPAGEVPAVASPAPAAAPAAVAVGTTFGKIVVDSALLRCWPGAVAAPPVFEETLQKDQVVAVGRSENGFRAVLLPLGPLGYVSKKFAEASPEGRVKTKGAKVSFRFRPRSSEPPVSQLPDATVLQVLGEQDDWYRVRVPGVEAWVAEAEVQIATTADPAMATAYAEWQSKQEAEVKARLDQIAAQLARQAQDQTDLAAVQLVQDAFTAELKKPLPEQHYAPLNEALEKLLTTLAPESAGRAGIDALKKRIEKQLFVVEATAVIDSKAPAIEQAPPEKVDQLERFQSIGWLRYERRLAQQGIYYLEKGGQRQYVLSCNTGRYDLSLFVGREVGVMGPRRRPATESLSVLDVERLEVLGTLSR
jgi:hypothetical protein